jgi:predicted nucleotidyltransferase
LKVTVSWDKRGIIKCMNAQKQIERLCREYDVNILYVFGSRAEEVQALAEGRIPALAPSENDVDIAILTAVQLSLDQKVRFAQALEALLDVPRVDLVTLANADPFLAANAIRGLRLFAHDPYQADEYDLYVLRRAGDLAPLERERMSLILHEEGVNYDAG